MSEIPILNSIFNQALVPTEENQMNFASQLPIILSSFSKPWISDSFLPFVVQWLPRHNLPVIKCVAEHFFAILSSTTNLLSTAPLVEAILSSEFPEVIDLMISAITDSASEPDLSAFIMSLSKSRFDSVRAVVPRIVYLASDKKSILSALAYDESFAVRKSVVMNLANYPPDLAGQVSVSLLSDSSSTIRSIIPLSVNRNLFFMGYILPVLITDDDWSVRSALAASLSTARGASDCLQPAIELSNDTVWQVRLTALQSLKDVLCRMKNAEDVSPEPIVTTLLKAIRMPQESLKIAAVNAFAALLRLKPDVSPIFVRDVIERQPLLVQLAFLEAMCADKQETVLQSDKGRVNRIAKHVAKHEDPEVRERGIRLLKPLADCFPEFHDRYRALAMKGLSNKADQVRQAALASLTSFAGDNPDKLIETYHKLKTSDKARSRKDAVMLLVHMYKTASDKRAPMLRGELAEFQQDSNAEVAKFAQSMLAQLE